MITWSNPSLRILCCGVARSALKNKQLIDEKEKLTAEKERYRNHLEAVFASVNDAIITIDNTRRIIAFQCRSHQHLSYRFQ